jgi:hypothetical protein
MPGVIATGVGAGGGVVVVVVVVVCVVVTTESIGGAGVSFGLQLVSWNISATAPSMSTIFLFEDFIRNILEEWQM